MTVTVTVANSVPAGSLGAAFSSLSISGLFALTGVEDTLTAYATGGQTNALALSATKNYHRVSTCATAADSVKLPAATVGQAHFIRNDGVASCRVYGTSPDTIDDIATGTGYSLPAGVGCWFVCTTVAKWYTDAAGTTTGSGANVLATSPALTTPNIGVASGASLTLTDDTDATSSTSAPLNTAGGLAVAKKGFFGGAVTAPVFGGLAVANIAQSASADLTSTSGLVMVRGGISNNDFFDVVLYNFWGQAQVIKSNTFGTPPGRTYGVNGGTGFLSLTLDGTGSAGTYAVSAGILQ